MQQTRRSDWLRRASQAAALAALASSRTHKRASLGSYFIRINDRVGIKGRRID